MGLSNDATRQIQKAADSFTAQIVSIVSADASSDARGDVIEQMRRAIAQISGAAPARGRRGRGGARRPAAAAAPRPVAAVAPRPAGGKRRKAIKLDAGVLGKFVAAVKETQGNPGAVSKKLGLSAFQRRRVVRAAIKEGLIKTTGNKRSTRYVLAKGK